MDIILIAHTLRKESINCTQYNSSEFLVSVVYYRVYYLIRRVEICIGLGRLGFCSPIIVSNSLKFTSIMLIILEIMLVFNFNVINNVVLANLYVTIIVKCFHLY